MLHWESRALVSQFNQSQEEKVTTDSNEVEFNQIRVFNWISLEYTKNQRERNPFAISFPVPKEVKAKSISVTQSSALIKSPLIDSPGIHS